VEYILKEKSRQTKMPVILQAREKGWKKRFFKSLQAPMFVCLFGYFSITTTRKDAIRKAVDKAPGFF